MRAVWSTIATAVLLSSSAAFAATQVPATRKAARRAFEAAEGAPFAPKVAAAAVLAADDAAAFGKGESTWFCAIPLEDGDRLRFVRVTLKDGSFASGELRYFALPAVPLEAADFEVLRRDFPLAAVRLGVPSPAPVVLLPARTRPWSHPVPPSIRTDVRMAPFERLFGGFTDVVARRLNVRAEGLALRVVHVAPDGHRLELGVARNVRDKSALSARTVLDAVGAAFPKRISDRSRTEYLATGTLAYEIVSAAEFSK